MTRIEEDIAERLPVVLRTFATSAVVSPVPTGLPALVAGCAGAQTVIDARTSGIGRSRCHPSNGSLAGTVKIDDEKLPFRPGALDLLVSVLALHTTNDMPGALLQARKALKPDGLFLGVLCAGDTLCELRSSLLQAEAECEGGAGPRVMPFADVRELGGLMQRAGFALPVADTDTVTLTYSSPLHLMRELRSFGATNILRGRAKNMMRRKTLLRACEIYGENFGDADGRVRATVDIVTLTGWAPDASQQQPLKPGSAASRLADALGTTEHLIEEPDA
ncbi:MAG: methyltransferase domain-containing protein [Hyphomicrobiaceae bacterium]